VEVGARSFLFHSPTVALLEALRHSDDPDQVASTLSAKIGIKLSGAEIAQAVSALPPALFSATLAKIEKTSIDFRCTLIPAGGVVWLATRCTRLFSPWIIGLFGFLTLAFLPLFWRSVERGGGMGQMTWRETAMVGLGFVIGAVIHELGHATALMKHGEKPGRIGIGVYWFWPVFFTDVNAAWRLNPRQRIAVDVGGVYFQVWFLLGVLALTQLERFGAASCLVILCGGYSILHSLNPVFKSDGYWLLTDALRLSSLHDRSAHVIATKFKSHRVRESLIFSGYALIVCLYFCYLAAIIPPAVGRLCRTLYDVAGETVFLAESQAEGLWSNAETWLRFWGPVKHGLFPLASLILLSLWIVGVIRRTKKFATCQWKTFRSANTVV
jgi:putative peptide zinc metalloprotease protein